MAEVSIAQAKAGFAALVARAEAGERIVLTRNGRPVACLGPLPEKKQIVYGDLKHLWVSKELEDRWDAGDFSLPEDVIKDFEESADSLAQEIKDSERKR
ncbi:MAG TPA: type II toxin-antitoxin system prevent-host-death family antitoxin [Stellaceae bacterium]|nr:type II toxin-antitoxin system prevent-host-death family antitoxin [Stellaceae bacterium]